MKPGNQGRSRVTTGQRAHQQTGLARALSKMGFCSRSRAWEIIKGGRVRVNGTVRLDPEWPVTLGGERIEVDGVLLEREERVYLMLNKPRGLVTSASDEQGRQTVFSCLAGHELPFVSPIGRLDKASEGLLLFTNDTGWAGRITSPESHLDKRYHVQVDCLADEALVENICHGVTLGSEQLKARRATLLRHGTRNSWLEIVLDEGKNRHIRRLLEALGVTAMRLVRVAIGPLELGSLPKGQFRKLTRNEVNLLARATSSASPK